MPRLTTIPSSGVWVNVGTADENRAAFKARCGGFRWTSGVLQTSSMAKRTANRQDRVAVRIRISPEQGGSRS
jgi:hypothetical protein